MPDGYDHEGTLRRMGRMEPTSEAKATRASMMNIQAFRESLGLPGLIPEADWVEIDDSATFGTQFILDQQSCNGCVGFSAAGAEGELRFEADGNFEVLSGSSVYARVNGNQDQGASITDAMTALQQYGVCLKSEFDLPHLYVKQMTAAAIASAATRKSAFCVTVGSWAEVMTALQMRLKVQLPVQATFPQWNTVDQYGVVPYCRGSGDHSVFGRGAKKLPSGWAVRMPNSWGQTWGMGDGTAYIQQAHVDGCGTADDGFAHGSSVIKNLPQPE